MTITSSVKLAGGTLSVCGRTVLSGVPAAVAASSAAAAGAVDGVFIGADLAEPASRHVISLGTLRFGAVLTLGTRDFFFGHFFDPFHTHRL